MVGKVGLPPLFLDVLLTDPLMCATPARCSERRWRSVSAILPNFLCRRQLLTANGFCRGWAAVCLVFFLAATNGPSTAPPLTRLPLPEICSPSNNLQISDPINSSIPEPQPAHIEWELHVSLGQKSDPKGHTRHFLITTRQTLRALHNAHRSTTLRKNSLCLR